AVLVWNPVTFFAGVVEIQHRSHRIDTQSVGMISIEPEQAAAHQKTADIVTAIVEDRALPIRMKALSRVSMLVEICTVEVGQSVLVAGEVRGYPVENHSDLILM